MDYETMTIVRENHKLLLAIAEELGLFEPQRNETIAEVKDDIYNAKQQKSKKRTV